MHLGINQATGVMSSQFRSAFVGGVGLIRAVRFAGELHLQELRFQHWPQVAVLGVTGRMLEVTGQMLGVAGRMLGVTASASDITGQLLGVTSPAAVACHRRFGVIGRTDRAVVREHVVGATRAAFLSQHSAGHQPLQHLSDVGRVVMGQLLKP